MADTKFTQEETLAAIQAKAAETQADSFIIKVMRRRAGTVAIGLPPEMLCTVSGASLNHLAFAEQWLARLGGGGQYMLSIFHPTAAMKQIGGQLLFSLSGESRAFDATPFSEASWKGPPVLEYPLPSDFPTKAPVQGPIFPGEAPNQTPRLGQTIPSQQQPAQIMHSPAEDFWKAQNAQLQQQLAEMRAEATRAQIQRDADLKLAALERKLDQIVAQPKVDNSNKLVEAVTALAAGLGPIVSAMITSSAQTRQLMVQSQQTAQAEQQKLFAALLQRPAVPPEFSALVENIRGSIEKIGEKDPHTTTMIAQMADVTGGLMNTMMGIMQQVTEMSGGKAEPTGLIVLREISKMIEAFGASQATLARGVPKLPRPVPTTPQALPAPVKTAPVSTAAPLNGVPSNGKPNGAAQTPTVSEAPSPLDEIEQLIRAEVDPAEISAKFIASADDPRLQEEVGSVDGGLIEVFQKRLGTAWIIGHEEYLKALLETLETDLRAKGFLLPEDEASEGEEAEA